MNKIKSRSEINNFDKWDLTTIYNNDDAFYSDCDKCIKLIDGFDKIKNGMMESADNLYQVIKKDEEIDILINHLYMYAHLNKDSETNNPAYQKMFGKINNIINTYSEVSSFIIPTLLEYDYSVIENFYLEKPELKQYEFVFVNIFRKKIFTLTKSEEKILSSFEQTLSFPENIYDTFSNADLKFGSIKDEHGDLVEITDSNFSLYIKSKDRNVRKAAFDTLYNGYKKYENTISLMLSNDIKVNNTLAKLRKYNSALESSLFADNVDISIYNNLVSTVESNLKPLHDYLELKREILNLDKIHMYDVYASLLDDYDSKKYTFDEAEKLVVSSLKVLGDDYLSIINEAFSKRWIDKYPNIAKASGAYSSGSYTTNPFILLNFQGELNDVSTLAHELGHSVHSYYSRHNNPYQYSQYKIFVAEVASTVNELLLSKYLLNNSNDNFEKLNILNRLIELYRTTIYRQTMFASFEKKIYALEANGEILTPDIINNEYYKLNQKYFGNDAVVDELIKYEWEKVPHFYYNFYVYKYATGLSAATAIVNKILNNEKDAVKDYIEFLKTGGRDYPVNELKIAGVDMNDKKVIEDSIETFKDLLLQFKELYYLTYKK